MTIVNNHPVLQSRSTRRPRNTGGSWTEGFTALHSSHLGLREGFAYQHAFEADPERARRLMVHLERGWRRQDAETLRHQATELSSMRKDQSLASPVFLSFCECEGLDPYVIGDAVLPRGLIPLPGDGHPWMETGSKEFEDAIVPIGNVWSGPTEAMAAIRPEWNRGGSAVVVQNCMTLDLRADLGRAQVRTDQGRGMLQLPDAIPESVLTASVGRRLEELVDHPALRGDLLITGADGPGPGRPRTVISFRCPGVHFRPGPSRVPVGTPALFVDPALNGADAVGDMLYRMILRIRAEGAWPAGHVLLREARMRVQLLNLARPRMEPLPIPTEDDVRGAIASQAITQGCRPT